jgi:TatD DNase family protein
MWIDSHCHLNHDRLGKLGGTEAVIAAARAGGVEGMLTICCRIREEFESILAVARRHEGVWCTVGTHPHDAGKPEEAAITLDELAALAQSDAKVVGIGESGLDYFYKNSEPEAQQENFRKHIRACVATGLPLVVHARDADDDIIRILREEGAGQGRLKGVMHCFSSSRKMGEEALALGFYISFSGIVTFDKAEELKEFAKAVPAERILVETDSPYLAPVPHRGEINQPALVAHTGSYVAQLRQVAPEEIAVLSTRNFFTLFDKARPEGARA